MPKPTHLPDDRDDHRPERAVGVLTEPHDRLGDDAEIHQPLVDQAVMVAEQPVPKEARHAETDDHRHEDDAARDLTRAACIGRDEERDEVAADHQDRREVERVFQREAERHPELPVIPRLDEIGDADPSRRLDDRPVVERHPDHLDERIGGEDALRTRGPAPGRRSPATWRFWSSTLLDSRDCLAPAGPVQRAPSAHERAAALYNESAAAPRLDEWSPRYCWPAIAFICSFASVMMSSIGSSV